jgi:hypothetical protein
LLNLFIYCVWSSVRSKSSSLITKRNCSNPSLDFKYYPSFLSFYSDHKTSFNLFKHFGWLWQMLIGELSCNFTKLWWPDRLITLGYYSWSRSYLWHWCSKRSMSNDHIMSLLLCRKVLDWNDYLIGLAIEWNNYSTRVFSKTRPPVWIPEFDPNFIWILSWHFE